MRKVLYAKYNRTRVPQYQTVTKIVQKDSEKKVIKQPLVPKAVEHVLSLPNKCDSLSVLYNKIKPVKCFLNEGTVEFEFCNGTSIADIIEKDMGSLEALLLNVKKYADILFDFNDDCVVEFQTSDLFEKVFGKIDEIKGIKAVSCADIDLIFDNVLFVEGAYVCIDYEWFMDCAIPIDFIRYRTLFCFYAKNHVYFHNKMSVSDFLDYFGIDEIMAGIFRSMDNSFQQMVHGSNWINIYTRNYEKKSHPLKDLMCKFSDIEGTLSQQACDIDELKTSLGNKTIIIDRMQKDQQRLLEQKAAIIREKDGEISRLRKKLVERDQEIVLLQEQVDDYTRKIQEVDNSLSWKITSPLRKVGDIVKRKR